MSKYQLNEVQQRWVEALESGQYQQGRFYLRVHRDAQDFFCCLGVACELATKAGVIAPAARIETKVPMPVYTYVGRVTSDADEKVSSCTSMPLEVCEYFGFHDSGGRFPANRVWSEQTANVGSLMELNDQRNKSFADIAAFVRKYPEVVFCTHTLIPIDVSPES